MAQPPPAHSGMVKMGKGRKGEKASNGNGANLGFEEKLWAAADNFINTLAGQFEESARLEKAILKNLASLGFSPKEPA